MEKNIVTPMDPNYIPPEYAIPYDVVDLPSQGILYPNKISSIKVEYLTAFDETILSSPNIATSGKMLDILLERKIKDLGFDSVDLLISDRVAILLFLRSTAFGPDYTQLVIDTNGEVVEGTIDLSTLKQKKLTINPDPNGLFDFKLPTTKQIVKFKFLTGRDEQEIGVLDKNYKEKTNSDISNTIFFRLEKQVQSIDGVTDKIKLSHMLKTLTLRDARLLRQYMDEIEPGIDFKTKARIRGEESVECFLRFNSSFFFPKL
jgi:hypothetical protein